MKKKGLIGLALILALTLGTGIGAYAASKTWTHESKGVITYNDDIVIDGNAIGFWVKDSAGIGSFDSTHKIYTITDNRLTADSIVDVYYSEEGKDAVSKANVAYSQETGKTICTFKKVMDPQKVKIIAMHVINPDQFSSPTLTP